MPETTRGLPYPSISAPNNPPADFKALAEALDAALADVDAEITASLTPETHTFSYLNGWENYGGSFAPGKAHKTKDGFVHLQGLIRNGTIGRTIFSLPANFCPAKLTALAARAGDGTVHRLDIYPTGAVQIYGTAGQAFGTYLQLDGLSFKAA